MKELLPLLPHPSHYIGIEEGAVRKAPGRVRLRCALAFPDLYEVGMSYLGQKILYGILNGRDDIAAERVFAPSPEAGELLRGHGVPLATLESDTPLGKIDLLGFAVTHELCFTNVLYMLDLAGIPLRSAARDEDLAACPLVVAGGGCAISAEPLAPFMDLMLLGEGEAMLPELCDLLIRAREAGWPRSRLIREATAIPGVYAPSLYTHDAAGGVTPLSADTPRPGRRVVADLDAAPYPQRQVVPFGAVHNRLSLEIARGCTRGCRFCQAGILYRPARERSLDNIQRTLAACLSETGFDDVSFLSLSTGDFSALKTLFLGVADRCAAEQIAVSLPSLRVGSLDPDIMARMAGIRRTGATLAPEAGSQRLRDVINKGVTEDELLAHVRALAAYGWQQVKLYFMIGLPTETRADLDAIVDLCRKARDAAGRPRLQITAAISPFVPKPHTPFQWEPQMPVEEIRASIQYLRDLFRAEKSLKLRWHEPDMSRLEGILSRGDRRLADVVESAYRKGALFASWVDHFQLEPWLEALAEHGLSEEAYTGPRPIFLDAPDALDEPDAAPSTAAPGTAAGDMPDGTPGEAPRGERGSGGALRPAPLPWDHLEAGVSRAFLLRERERALAGARTEDCRYAACRQCGACDTARPSLLPGADGPYRNRLNFPARDQTASLPPPERPAKREKPAAPELNPALTARAARYRVWHSKEDEAAYISQLELQTLLDKAMRRAGLPLSFSQGFHPMPLLSFGRALPVGVQSRAEWFSVTLREPMSAAEVMARLAPRMISGMRLLEAVPIPIHDKSFGGRRESFVLRCLKRGDERAFAEAWAAFAASPSFLFARETKKGPVESDLRPLVAAVEQPEEGETRFTTDWSGSYLSPLTLARAITPWLGPHELRLIKTAQTL